MSEPEGTEEGELTEEDREALRRGLLRAAAVVGFLFGGKVDGLPAGPDPHTDESATEGGE